MSKMWSACLLYSAYLYAKYYSHNSNTFAISELMTSDRQTDGRISNSIDPGTLYARGRTDFWTDGWTDRQTDERISNSQVFCNPILIRLH